MKTQIAILIFLLSIISIDCQNNRSQSIVNNDSIKIDSLIGKVYKDSKELIGLEQMSAGMLQDSLNNRKFGISAYIDKSYVYYVFLDEIKGNNVDNLSYKILDIVVVGKLNKNEILGTYNCQMDSTNDYKLIAIYREDKYDSKLMVYYDILKAWKADIKREKIDSISTKGITCVNEGQRE